LYCTTLGVLFDVNSIPGYIIVDNINNFVANSLIFVSIAATI